MPGPGMLVVAPVALGWHALFAAAKVVTPDAPKRARALSTLHSLLVVQFSVRALTSMLFSSTSSSISGPPNAFSGAPSAEMMQWAWTYFAIAAGYYLWALAQTATAEKEQAASMHHFVCCLCYALVLHESLMPVLMLTGVVFLLAESSTAFANIRWFAFKLSVRAGSSSQDERWLFVAKAAEVCFMLSFLLTRIFIAVPMSISWWTRLAPRAGPLAVGLFFKAANLTWNSLNIWTAVRWFSRPTWSQIQAESTKAHKANQVYMSASCLETFACECTCSSDCHLEIWFVPKSTLDQSASDDLDVARDRQHLTKIHGNWYDLRNFQHPGGPVAKSLVGGREGTALFEAHHPFTSRSKLMAVLAKFKVRVSADDEPVQSPVFEQCDKARANKAKNDEKAEEKPRMPTAAELDSLLAAGDDGAHYKWNSGDAFELELKQEVKRYFEGEAKRRGVSFTQATKATPLRWLQILGHCAMFCSTVPAIVRGEWWALIVCPTLCWVAMVNYWHDACHFALSSRWYVNALTPYLMPWFSSPTTWYHQHVIGHHSYPNVGHKDPDLAHAPQLMREHVSIKWRPVHKKQHSIWRFGFMWTVAVGLGLHLMADTKLMLQEEYNRVVPAMPGLRCWSWRLSHLLGRVIYLFFSYGWPWFVMDSNLKALVFSVVPMTIFSLLFMLNSQVNHLTPETGHAESNNYWRHSVVTAIDFGISGPAWHRFFCFAASGGLNHQVEHHLFPTVCHCHHAALHPLVSRLCDKHGVSFVKRKGYIDALEKHLEHTDAMGVEPATMAPNGKNKMM